MQWNASNGAAAGLQAGFWLSLASTLHLRSRLHLHLYLHLHLSLRLRKGKLESILTPLFCKESICNHKLIDLCAIAVRLNGVQRCNIAICSCLRWPNARPALLLRHLIVTLTTILCKIFLNH